ncbi:hypothetical protein H2200_002554 [Cladophialophora chaetospira]|uniref:SP-RING-type domain-containing protein n=1 Tax=Cladophialophora chaetospira TaxID=386627 RepID=A0AA38XJW7_9EURO|nr:hypothetical protein H2200_002554 [Cladophialophora chaetospira]
MATTFEHQPLAAPLNDDGLKALKDLLPKTQQRISTFERDRHAPTKRHVQNEDYLKQAVDALEHATTSLTERAYRRKTKYLKSKAHRQKERTQANPDAEDEDEDGDAAAGAEADAKYEEFERKSNDLTKRMDMAMRGLVDDLNWLAQYPDILGAVVDQAQASSEEQRRVFEARNQSPPRRKRRQTTTDDGDEGQAEDGEEDEEEEPPQRRTRATEPPTLDPSETPYVQLTTGLADQKQRWDSLSLTERYAQDNTYKGWKAALWDSQNPGENPPPMPHETLWFAVEEGRSATASSSTQRGRQRGKRGAPNTDTSFTEPGEDDEDSDIEISAQNTRIKCPLTLLPYKVPMTTKNCNHTFERTAIMTMLDSCTTRPKKIKCPETGCNADINGEDDLYENHLLRRHVARILKREAEKNVPATSDIEDEDDDDDVVKGTQRQPVGVTSSPVAPSTGRRSVGNIKNESRASRASTRSSVVPNSQVDGVGGSLPLGSPRSQASASRPPRGTQILDLEDDD